MNIREIASAFVANFVSKRPIWLCLFISHLRVRDDIRLPAVRQGRGPKHPLSGRIEGLGGTFRGHKKRSRGSARASSSAFSLSDENGPQPIFLSAADCGSYA